MGTRGYGYNEIHVRIHIIMDSQIPVYYTCGYPFSYPPHALDRFYPRVPVGMPIFATPSQRMEVILGYQPIWDVLSPADVFHCFNTAKKNVVGIKFKLILGFIINQTCL
jgi:hypothetical protein